MTPAGFLRFSTEDMADYHTFCRERGLRIWYAGAASFSCPPLCISAEQAREGPASIDQGLELSDVEVRG